MADIFSAFHAISRDRIMIAKLLVRGLVAGFIAGLITFGFAKVAGEPAVARAIAFEQQADAARGDAPEPEIVSRKTQSGLGLLTAVVLYATSVGGLFALVFAYAAGRSGRISAQALSVWIGLAAFVALQLVPGLKYPANPPSVGEPETIAYRTELYFLMVLVSVMAIVFAVKVRSACIKRVGPWTASIGSSALYVAIVVTVAAALPRISEVPATFPATVLWDFRVAAFGMHAVLWSTLAIAFGGMTAYSQRMSPSGRAQPDPAMAKR
jgi:hypothetical protein